MSEETNIGGGQDEEEKNSEGPPHLSENLSDEIASMWEIPQMYQFLCLAKETLGIQHLSMYEMERMLLMPKASKQLGSIMTSLLSPPMPKSKLRTMPPMPYQFWTNLLAQKALGWFKVYQVKEGDSVKVLETIGVEPEFWKIFPQPELISERKFDKLSLRERVWLLKTVCDTLIHSRRSLQDEIVRNYLDDDSEMVLGKDRHGARYIYFPIFLDNDLRVYRHCLDNKILLSLKHGKKESKPKAEVASEKKMVKRKRKSWRYGKLPTKSKKRAAKSDKEKIELTEQEDKNDDGGEVQVEDKEKVDEETKEDGKEEINEEEENPGDKNAVEEPRDEEKTEEADVPNAEPEASTQAKDGPPPPEEQETQSLRDDVSNCSKTDDEKINEKRAASPVLAKSRSEVSKSDDEKIIETKSPNVEEEKVEGCEGIAKEPEESTTSENNIGECISDTTHNADDSNTADTELNSDTTRAASKREIEEFKRMITDLGESSFRLVADSSDALRDLVACFEAQNYPEGPETVACEVQLIKKLNALITELETIEATLRQSKIVAKEKLQEEWNKFQDGDKENGGQPADGEKGSNTWIIGSQGCPLLANGDTLSQSSMEGQQVTEGGVKIKIEKKDPDEESNGEGIPGSNGDTGDAGEFESMTNASREEVEGLSTSDGYYGSTNSPVSVSQELQLTTLTKLSSPGERGSQDLSQGDSLRGACEMYTGSFCSQYLSNRTVHIPPSSTQKSTEESLSRAWDSLHNLMEDPACVPYLTPALCYSSFPPCASPAPNPLPEAPKAPAPPGLSRSLCREDCEMLQSTCGRSYAAARRHPLTGPSLVDCPDSAVESTASLSSCLTLTPSDPDLNEKDSCYWGNGAAYRGLINTSASGLPCLKWMHHFPQSISDYPELKGHHNYCRNPGGTEPQPWCYIDVDGRAKKQSCSISRCSEHSTTSVSPELPRKLNQEGTCEVYTGKTCEQYVGNQTVYIPHPMTQKMLEEKLMQAFGVINISKDLSRNCAVYAKPSLCFSVFPICRENRYSTELFNLLHSGDQDVAGDEENEGSDELAPPRGIRRKRSPQISHRSSLSVEQNERMIGKRFGEPRAARRDMLNRKLRRICREDCETLENELCRTEYAIAKRHPLLGGQFPLPECFDLPLHGTKESHDCLSLGILLGNNAQENDRCYWGNGSSYRGVMNVSKSGRPCVKWSTSTFNLPISDFPELQGRHSYCRNPPVSGSNDTQPWCYVEANNKFQKEPCEIPRCADSLWIYAVIGLALASGFVFIIGCYCCCYKSRKIRRRPSHNLPPGKMMTGVQCDKNIYDGRRNTSQPIELSSLLTSGNNGGATTPGTGTLSSASSRTSTNRVPQYSLDNVSLLQELGEGAFGKVYKGQLQPVPGAKCQEGIYVAVKTLKENATPKTQGDFKREVDLMTDLRHPNIICLLGVILKGEPMCMLFEYMTQGDLHEFLICHSPRSEVTLNNASEKVLEQAEFLHISLQIASGMEYLAGHHYVHRDLAARNCLVGENLTVKISDFGLSRDIYSSDYYRVQSKSLLPVRWMPPESILYGKFTTESDVWSFGVVLWEIYSYGLQPYYGYNNQEVIDMIRSRQLLPCPEDCPTMVYSLMIECWHEVANRRPQFPEIHHRLHNWYVNQTYLMGQKGSSKVGSPAIQGRGAEGTLARCGTSPNGGGLPNHEHANVNSGVEEKTCCSPKLSGARKVLPTGPQVKCSPNSRIQNGAQMVVRLPDPSKDITETRLSK
ncbi:uncharacterized protein LOC107038367 [Diachasma alloeum]|uniref:uncharacterized protein LOC107038367 n=1 Tax=Diachasma alloeum TaxID=454923 RepID=UPI0010FB415E|nr:uncharacterized protein LOC107038367 [Diachasma alloeum]